MLLKGAVKLCSFVAAQFETSILVGAMFKISEINEICHGVNFPFIRRLKVNE